MRTIICLFFGACAVVAGASWIALRAADSPPSTARGRVLVLENERILEGDIEREGDRYRIRRNLGESWIPADKVLCLCVNMDEAYRYLRERADLRDPDERLRLARWCQFHGLREQGLAEATAAVALQPGNAEGQRLLRVLQHSSPSSETVARPTRGREEPTANYRPSSELPLEVTIAFSRRVQPILMNACVACHADPRSASHPGSFRLVRTFPDDAPNSRPAQQNLAAALAQINLDNWQASPLLTKAVAGHGKNGQPPIHDRQTPTYRILEEWVQMTAANLHLLDDTARKRLRVAAPAPLAESATEARPDRLSKDRPSEPAAGQRPAKEQASDFAVKPQKEGDRVSKASAPMEKNDSLKAENQKPIEPAKFSAISEAAPLPKSPAEPADPFDPLIFNQQMHPGRGP